MGLNYGGGLIMITNTQDKVQDKINVDEALQKISRSRLVEATRNAGDTMTAIGIAEIAFGVLAMIVAAFTGIIFTVLLGAAIVVSGTLGIIMSIARNNLARFYIGLIAAAAGVLVIAQPIYGLNFLAILIGLYLLATGITRLFGKEKPLWTRTGGVVGILMSIVVFVNLSTISAPLIGLIVGINIIMDGIVTVRTGTDLRKAA